MGRALLKCRYAVERRNGDLPPRRGAYHCRAVMRRRGICVLLAVMLCMCCTGATAFAAAEDAMLPEETLDISAEPDENAAEERTAREDDADMQAEEEPDASHGPIGAGLPEGAAAYSPQNADESPQISCTAIGDGTVYALVDGEGIELSDWIETVDFPVEDAQFAAVPDDIHDDVTGVTIDGEHVDFAEEDGMWVFTADTLENSAQIVVSFGNIIPGSIQILGPGKVSILEEDEWSPVSEDEPEFEGEIGTVVRLLATSTQAGYACTFVSAGGKDVEPVMYSAEGPVFEFAIEAPLMDVMVRFLAEDELITEIAGKGTLEVSISDTWVEIENGARLPFDPEQVSEDDPMVFRAVAAEGYAFSEARYESYPLIATKMDSDEDPPVEQYMFSIPDPSDDGLLRVTFLASSDSTVEWLRGSDTTTGISWAAPLGTSQYGVSNVTQGSNVRTTLLTQGAAYEQARTLAARFGSVFTAWDFSLVNAEGSSYRPTVPILFSIPIPAGYPASTQSLRMLHISSDGQVTENPIEIRTDAATGRPYIFMRAESFSTFVLVNTASGSNVPTAVPTYAPTAVPTAPAAGTTPAPTASKAPGTADSSHMTMWILLAFAAAAAVAAGVIGCRRSLYGRR